MVMNKAMMTAAVAAAVAAVAHSQELLTVDGALEVIVILQDITHQHVVAIVVLSYQNVFHKA